MNYHMSKKLIFKLITNFIYTIKYIINMEKLLGLGLLQNAIPEKIRSSIWMVIVVSLYTLFTPLQTLVKYIIDKLQNYKYSLTVCAINGTDRTSLTSYEYESIRHYIDHNKHLLKNIKIDGSALQDSGRITHMIKNSTEQKSYIVMNTGELFNIKSKKIKILSQTIDTESTESTKLTTFQYIISGKNMKQIDDFINECKVQYTTRKLEQITALEKAPTQIIRIKTDLVNTKSQLSLSGSSNLHEMYTLDGLYSNSCRKVKEIIDRFIGDEKFYRENQIPFKLTFLFYGPPGTGKTSTLRAMGNYLKRDIMMANLSEIDISDYSKLFNGRIFCSDALDEISTEPNDRILALEEFDHVIDSQHLMITKNKKKNDDEDEKDTPKIKSFNIMNMNNTDMVGTLLECLDGVATGDKRIIVITTNNIEKFDKALIRPGRIDHVIYFDRATSDDIYDMLDHAFNTKIERKKNQFIDFVLSHAVISSIILSTHLLQNSFEETIRIIEKRCKCIDNEKIYSILKEKLKYDFNKKLLQKIPENTITKNQLDSLLVKLDDVHNIDNIIEKLIRLSNE